MYHSRPEIQLLLCPIENISHKFENIDFRLFSQSGTCTTLLILTSFDFTCSYYNSCLQFSCSLGFLDR